MVLLLILKIQRYLDSGLRIANTVLGKSSAASGAIKPDIDTRVAIPVVSAYALGA